MPRRTPQAKTTRKARRPDVLSRLESAQSAAVLRGLLKRHPDLVPETERIALDLVADVKFEGIAEDVADCLRLLDLDDLNNRAGEDALGYTPPEEAAWELQQEAVQPFFGDLRRLIALGLEAPAIATCQGIILGLYRCRDMDDHAVIGWAPDFLAEAAAEAIEILAKPGPQGEGPGWRLPEAFFDQVADWEHQLTRRRRRRR